MLFIPFIENAFKFGETKKSEAMISIEFRISAKEIQFECKNAFQPTLESNKDSGLGNVLIAKRIAHLYPEKHLLETFVKDGIYHVKLTISHP
jgi:LytS/YehU family sensor histidine kinase